MQLNTEHQQTAIPLAGNGVGYVTPEAKPMFDQTGLRTVEEFFSVSGNALAKPGLGKRYRARIEFGNSVVFYKRYDGESLRSLLQRWIEDGERSAIATREVNVARALEKIGIASFKPLAWGWTENWGTNQKSFLMMSQVPGTSLERWLESTKPDFRKKIQLAQELARFAKRLHEHGWFHRDFYLCHIFISERNGEINLALVDLARMFRPRWRCERWQIKDLAQLDFSTPAKDFPRTMRLRFARIYFGVERFSSAHKAMFRKIARRSKAMAARELKRKTA